MTLTLDQQPGFLLFECFECIGHPPRAFPLPETTKEKEFLPIMDNFGTHQLRLPIATSLLSFLLQLSVIQLHTSYFKVSPI